MPFAASVLLADDTSRVPSICGRSFGVIATAARAVRIFDLAMTPPGVDK